MSRMISFGLLILLVVVLGIVFYQVMAMFLLPLFLAVMLAVVFHPLHHWMLLKCKGRQRIAALLTTLAMLLIVLVPGGWVITMASLEGISLATKINVASIQEKIDKLRDRAGLNYPFPSELREIEARFKEIEALETQAGSPKWNSSIVKLRVATRDLHDKLVDRQAHPKPDEPPLTVTAEEMAPMLATIEHILRGGKPRNDKTPDTEELEKIEEESPLMSEAAEEETSEEDASEGETEENDALVSDSTANEASSSESQEEAPPSSEMFGPALRAGPVEEDEDDYDPILLFERAQGEFAVFKEKLLGGPYIGAIKQVANPSNEQLRSLAQKYILGDSNWIVSMTGDVAAYVGKTIVGAVIMIIAVYFFFAEGPAMLTTLMRLSPLDDAYERELLIEFDSICRAVVTATLLAAVVQGLLAGFGFWLAGLGSVFLLMLLTTIFALVPFFGAATVWIPAALYLYFYEERLGAAVLLALYGAGIVSTSDNIIKPLVLAGTSNLHPLLALLSVLGGVQVMGPIGIFAGPMIVVFLQAMLDILQREMTNFERHREGAAPEEKRPAPTSP